MNYLKMVDRRNKNIETVSKGDSSKRLPDSNLNYTVRFLAHG